MDPLDTKKLEVLYAKASAAKKPAMANGVHVTCPHGMKVYTVGGSEIRNTIDSDFFQGSGYNSHFIPKNEIWIDNVVPAREWIFIVIHECTLAEKVKKGLSIGPAYDHAKRAEDRARKLTR